MSVSLNNVTTATDYTAANTLTQFGTVRINIQITNASALWEWADDGFGGGQPWNPEEFLLPGKYSFDRRASAARFRDGAAGVPAQVTCTLLTKGDIGA